MTMQITPTVEQFDHLPAGAAVPVTTAATLTGLSTRTIYRLFKRGILTKISIGDSTRVRVSELRALIG